jgi:hypothetical protein
MPRFTHYGLFFVALAVTTSLAISVRKHTANPAP